MLNVSAVTISSASGNTVSLDVSALVGEDKKEATELNGDRAEKTKERKVSEVDPLMKDNHTYQTVKMSDETNERVCTLDENKNLNNHHHRHNQRQQQQKEPVNKQQEDRDGELH